MADKTYVVTHDLVTFRDPEDAKDTPRDQRSFLSVGRGEPLPEGVSQREIDQGLKFGAIAEAGSDEAEFAKRGLPRSSSLPGGVANTPSPLGGSLHEKDQIVKAALTGVPGPANANSSVDELMRLPGDHIAVMARALGADVTEDATKRNLVEFIVGKGEGATAPAEIAEQREQRDDRQLQARDFGGEHGLTPKSTRDEQAAAGEGTSAKRGGSRVGSRGGKQAEPPGGKQEPGTSSGAGSQGPEQTAPTSTGTGS